MEVMCDHDVLQSGDKQIQKHNYSIIHRHWMLGRVINRGIYTCQKLTSYDVDDGHGYNNLSTFPQLNCSH